MLSKYSFGTYRVTYQNPLHKEALKFALDNGIKHIDTSSNYMYGEAEVLIGQVLENRKREDFVIVSKGGYIQGPLLKKVKEGLKVDDLVKYDEDCFHSINPDFISEQIEASLKRLNTSYIDVYLLHNPEYYLLKEIKGGMTAEAMLEHYNTMQQRIKRVFALLELKAKEGKIKAYGISSNSFAKKRSDMHFLEYKHLVGYAKEIMGDKHHFKVIQLPMNLFERDGEECAKWAHENGLEVQVNRPLNAFKENKMLRLASYDECINYELLLNQVKEIPNEHFQEALKELLAIENEYRWAGDVDDIIEYEVIPYMVNKAGLDPIYFQLFDNFLDGYKNNVKSKISKKVSEEIKIEEPLDFYALKFLEEKEYITRILVGMRDVRYVQKVLAYNRS
ncbi:aldo/keto reductase [Halarcobacter ebronensis]|uniref:Oxidoreductase n=1 Tax=Halarcobacter ebronensis TaxID=1462615 RepID=A0A4Q1ASZ7_9BACT|nr:aldo/keto reductase [Halarcobacter ebronensis]QKF82329.1 aldo/keto reductase [Halarcobacter ebronensis]RXK07641.1 oxidoreductase [Halarcobacter ebronensis]